MDAKETRAFAKRLMDEVWRPFDYTKLGDFYMQDVIGHHRTQTIHLQDIENRLRRDRLHWTDPVYDIPNLIVQPDAFALRFIFSATRIDTGKRDTTEGIYFYYLKDGKISEFWHLASVDFDYFEKQ
ncbi:MAG: nuclear transport factor 2 family protein [Methanocella sp.]|jgi:predicted ester cyclase